MSRKSVEGTVGATEGLSSMSVSPAGARYLRRAT